METELGNILKTGVDTLEKRIEKEADQELPASSRVHQINCLQQLSTREIQMLKTKIARITDYFGFQKLVTALSGM